MDMARAPRVQHTEAMGPRSGSLCLVLGLLFAPGCDDENSPQETGTESEGASSSSSTGEAADVVCEALGSADNCDGQRNADGHRCGWVDVRTYADPSSCEAQTVGRCVALEVHGQDCGPQVSLAEACNTEGDDLQPSYYQRLPSGEVEFTDHRGDERPSGWSSCFLSEPSAPPAGCQCDCVNPSGEFQC